MRMHCLTVGTGVTTPGAAAADATDARLIWEVAAGDRHAFETLYRTYFPRLSRFLHWSAGSVPLREEIINDTMLVVWQKARTYDATCKVSTWIFAIAYRKARKAFHALDEPVASDPDMCEGTPECQPEYRFERLRQRDEVDAAIAALPLAQRTVVQLTFYHDMGYAEIADVMECPVNTVKTRMFHARRRLARLLADRLKELS
jgi:RNA polymerase sigma factor (sigma-70 family)